MAGLNHQACGILDLESASRCLDRALLSKHSNQNEKPDLGQESDTHDRDRKAPCLRYPRTHSMLSATMSVVRSCCDRSGRAVSWKHGLPTCRRGLTPSRYQSGEINRTG